MKISNRCRRKDHLGCTLKGCSCGCHELSATMRDGRLESEELRHTPRWAKQPEEL